LQFFIFSESKIKSEDEVIFGSTELGKLKEVLPFKALASLLPEKKLTSGRKAWLSNEGEIALMFLKHHTGLSDADLIEHLNNNFAMQLFCGIRLNKFERIKDKNLPSAIRCRLSRHLDMDKFQQTCLQYWKGELTGLNILMNDAVVYESYIKYPTDVKLLWDSTSWIYEKMFLLCEELGLRKPRSKYLNHKIKQKSFSKRKKKSYKDNKRRIKQLLRLLDKGLGQMQIVLDHYHKAKQNLFIDDTLRDSFFTRLKTIRTIFTQQKYMSLHPDKKSPDRIVSLAKPWVRAIVRGKENKPVEFGPKIHISQTDGINYIEHYSYRAFNETKRLKSSIFNHERIFRTRCTHYAADNIYPTNENRRYISAKSIYTNFVPKGKVNKEHEAQLKQIRSILGKQRATVLEGSFGNEKLHYSLNKIKARLEETEKLWIFFGVMTANAVKIASRRESQNNRKAA
jgi:hypothetical protein